MSTQSKFNETTPTKPVKGAWWTLGVLSFVALIDYADRGLIGIALEGIKQDFDLSDTQLGLLGGTAFVTLRLFVTIPIGRLADVWNRRNVVVISLSLISLMTAAFGVARNVLTLIIARLVVGAATAGTTPPTMSMIADLFPVRRRGLAMGFWNVGSVVGASLGFTIAGIITARYGWRVMMLCFGVFGLLIACIMMLAVREPHRRDSTGKRLVDDTTPPLRAVFKFMWTQRSLLHLAVGFSLVFGLDIILWIWLAPFFQRSFGMGVDQAGIILGSAWLIGGIPGTLLGGYLLDFAAKYDIRWHCWFVAIAVCIAILPASVLFLSSPETLAVSAVYLQSMMIAMTYAPMTTMSTALFHSHMRSIGYATFSIILYSGYAWGPSLVGYISTQLEPDFGIESLRYAMLSSNVFFLWAAWHFLRAAKTLKADYAKADDV